MRAKGHRIADERTPLRGGCLVTAFGGCASRAVGGCVRRRVLRRTGERSPLRGGCLLPPSAGAHPVVRVVVFGVGCCAAGEMSPLRGGCLVAAFGGCASWGGDGCAGAASRSAPVKGHRFAVAVLLPPSASAHPVVKVVAPGAGCCAARVTRHSFAVAVCCRLRRDWSWDAGGCAAERSPRRPGIPNGVWRQAIACSQTPLHVPTRWLPSAAIGRGCAYAVEMIAPARGLAPHS
ncbi:hypothetical protein FB475_5205 [Kribbella jejuensis]|uniref:Uncharacterized protein n=1 Tax=Kribbella jejuensis TaxID=236068 RepID=A0A542EAH3_9ACTN|nr:hypothetical protein FB475_5205 [Kribbella jejuensis]